MFSLPASHFKTNSWFPAVAEILFWQRCYFTSYAPSYCTPLVVTLSMKYNNKFVPGLTSFYTSILHTQYIYFQKIFILCFPWYITILPPTLSSHLTTNSLVFPPLGYNYLNFGHLPHSYIKSITFSKDFPYSLLNIHVLKMSQTFSITFYLLSLNFASPYLLY